MNVLLLIVLILISIKLSGHLATKVGQPAVLGKLLVGIILGPALLNWVEPSNIFMEFSEIGVLLLMFLAGLETDIETLKENWKSSISVAVFGIIIPFISAFVLGEVFKFTLIEAIFLGVLFSATSVSITVQVLKELNVLDTKESATILGAAVVDDILVVTLLALVLSFSGDSGQSESIFTLLMKKVLFFLIAFVIGKYILPKFLKLFSKLNVTVPLTAAGLIVAFAYAYISESLGMEGIIGTFLAGLFISNTQFHKEIEETIDPIANGLFVPFFYVSVGLNISFIGVSSQIGFILVSALVAILSKLFGSYFGSRILGGSKLSSLAIGSGMVSRGEVALIIATTGLLSGLLPEDYYTSVVIVIMITTLVAPPLLKYFFNKKEYD